MAVIKIDVLQSGCLVALNHPRFLELALGMGTETKIDIIQSVCPDLQYLAKSLDADCAIQVVVDFYRPCVVASISSQSLPAIFVCYVYLS